MLVTDREDVYQRVLVLRDHGRRPDDMMFWNTEVAYKYKMSSMQAALGLAQLERVDELIGLKRQIFAWYQGELENIEGITLNYEGPHTKNTYWMVTAILDPKFGLTKDRLAKRLNEKDISSRPFFHPLSSLPAYAGLEEASRAQQRNHVSYLISPYGINLPSALNMSPEKVEYVVDVLKGVFRHAGSATGQRS